MHVPYTTTPITTVGPLTGLDTSLHEFVGVSWHILMPYTLLGAALMLYSQTRLLRGQHALAHPVKSNRSKKKSPRRKQTAWIMAIGSRSYSSN